jgi:hypothetical protein
MMGTPSFAWDVAVVEEDVPVQDPSPDAASGGTACAGEPPRGRDMDMGESSSAIGCPGAMSSSSSSSDRRSAAAVVVVVVVQRQRMSRRIHGSYGAAFPRTALLMTMSNAVGGGGDDDMRVVARDASAIGNDANATTTTTWTTTDVIIEYCAGCRWMLRGSWIMS